MSTRRLILCLALLFSCAAFPGLFAKEGENTGKKEFRGEPLADRVITIKFYEVKEGNTLLKDKQIFAWKEETGSAENLDPSTGKVTRKSEYKIVKDFPLVTKRTVINENGKEAGESSYEYDKDGRLIREEAKNEKNDSLYKRLWGYDADGKIVEEHFEDSYPSTVQTIHKYDDKGRVKERVSYMSEDGASTESNTTFKLGKEGEILEEVTKIKDEDESTVAAHQYDKDLRRTSSVVRTYRGGEKVSENIHTWKFNDKGNLLEATSGLGTDKSKTVYEYDKQGRLVKISHDDPKTSWVREFEY